MDPAHGLWILEELWILWKKNLEFCIYLHFFFFFEAGVSNFIWASNISFTPPKVRDCSFIPNIFFSPKLFILKIFPPPPFFLFLKNYWDVTGIVSWIFVGLSPGFTDWLLIFFLFCFLSLPLCLYTHTHTFVLHYLGVIRRYQDLSYNLEKWYQWTYCRAEM